MFIFRHLGLSTEYSSVMGGLRVTLYIKALRLK